MSSSKLTTFGFQSTQEAGAEAESNPELYQHFANLVSTLPSSQGLAQVQLYRHDQGWHANPMVIVGSMVADACFAARASDVFIATHPKCGTTWTKALLFATVRRGEHPPGDIAGHPFNSSGLHDRIKFLEVQVYINNRVPDLARLPDPRLLATHVPFASLPRTVVEAGSKIVYVWREPKDTFVSLLAFMNKFRDRDGMEPLSVESGAEFFCNGVYPFGPYWDHVLGYWHVHLAHPERLLFLRYEEMLSDPAAHVRRLAEFVGRPFGVGEEDDRTVEDIVRLCSFQHLSGLKVTNVGTIESTDGTLRNSYFFRRGVVGDWMNHLSPEIAQRIDAITEAKFKDSGLKI